MRTSFFTVAILLASLTACGGGGGGGANPAGGGTERPYTRMDGNVTVLPDTSGNFTATQVVTISNDAAAKAFGVVQLRNVNGSISSTGGGSGYQIQVTLTAMAKSDAQARAALASMSVSHRDATDANTLYLDNEIQYGNFTSNNVSRSATVTATLPVALDYRLFEHSTNGTSASTGLSGSEAQVDSVNGSASLSGTFDSAAVNSANGTATASGDIANLQASSVNGATKGTLSCLRATSAQLGSSNGSVDVTVAQGGSAVFDLDARTDVGSASIVVAGTTPQGTQTTNHAHYQSTNYAGGSPKVALTGRSTTGSVSIHN